VQGRVEALVESNFSVNGVRQMSVHYSFKDHSGRVVQGKSEPMSPEQASAWKPGDIGAVRYDASAPQNSLWAGKEQA
jgi:hypothetical protein